LVFVDLHFFLVVEFDRVAGEVEQHVLEFNLNLKKGLVYQVF
jgi:hypothetical protein